MRVRNIMKNMVAGAVLTLGILGGSAGIVVTSPAQVSALSPAPECNAYFLTLPAWYNGLSAKKDGSCTVVSPKDLGGEENSQLSRFIWLIALNALQILFQVVAYLSVGFIMYGGFVYLTSAGRPDKITRGREMILNAVIGLAISLIAVSLVAFAGGQIGVK